MFLCDIFFCSRDIQVFLLCKFSHWWRQLIKLNLNTAHVWMHFLASSLLTSNLNQVSVTFASVGHLSLGISCLRRELDWLVYWEFLFYDFQCNKFCLVKLFWWIIKGFVFTGDRYNAKLSYLNYFPYVPSIFLGCIING